MKDSRPPITDMGSNFSNLQLTVVKGECSSAESEDNCRISYYLAIAIMFSISFANNFGRIGSVLLQIRCIDVNDKVHVGKLLQNSINGSYRLDDRKIFNFMRTNNLVFASNCRLL